MQPDNREISYQPLTVPEYRERLEKFGLPEFLIQHFCAIALDYQNCIFSGADKIIAEVTGVPPMTVQDFVGSHRAAFDSLDPVCDGAFGGPEGRGSFAAAHTPSSDQAPPRRERIVAYAANLGTPLSTNRKNRVLRAPATTPRFETPADALLRLPMTRFHPAAIAINRGVQLHTGSKSRKT